MKNCYEYLLIVTLSIHIMACSDNSDNPSVEQFTDCVLYEGIFVDSVVEGLGVNGGINDLTDKEGVFNYGCSPLSFHIGDIQLGDFFVNLSDQLPVVTPLNFTNDSSPINNQKVRNITRFLQTIDSDANPSNGININELVTAAANGITINFDQDTTSFSNDSTVLNFLSLINPYIKGEALNLIDIDVAIENLNQSLNAQFNEANIVGLYLISNRVFSSTIQFNYEVLEINADGTARTASGTNKNELNILLQDLSSSFIPKWEIINGELDLFLSGKYSIVTTADSNKRMVKFTDSSSFQSMNRLYKLTSDNLPLFDSSNIVGIFTTEAIVGTSDGIEYISGNNVLYFNNDSTGNMIQIDKTSIAFTWLIDSNNSIVISFSDPSAYVGELKLTLISGDLTSGEFLAEFKNNFTTFRFTIIRFGKQ